MAAAYRSMSSTTYASRTNTTITAPAGIQNGDVLILAHLTGGNGSAPSSTLPSGFTLLSGYPSSVFDSVIFTVSLKIAYKIANSESGDYSVTHAAASSQGVIVAVSGGSSGTPASSLATGTGSTSTVTAITVSSSDAFIIFIDQNWNLFGSASVPTGSTPTFTERLDLSTSLFYVATGNMTSSGSTGSKSQANLNDPTYPWQAALIGVESASAAVSRYPFQPFQFSLMNF